MHTQPPPQPDPADCLNNCLCFQVQLPAPIEEKLWDGALAAIQSEGPDNESCHICMNGQKLKKGLSCSAFCEYTQAILATALITGIASQRLLVLSGNNDCRNPCHMHAGGQCRWIQFGEQSWTRRTTEGVAAQVMSVMGPARKYTSSPRQLDLQGWI